MPQFLSNASAGEAALFEDPRIDWAKTNLARLGISLSESTVLELGPLEGGHTYGLIRAGAKSVTAVEAHPEAFLKCLVLKELLSIERVNFLYGDAVSFLRSIGHKYDIGFASGFLYHMANPVELIELLCLRSRSIFLWSLYWDKDFCKAHPNLVAGSSGVRVGIVSGFQHTLHEHYYGEALNYDRFWGGPDTFASWMEKNDILNALSHFGFSRQIFETESNPNGCAIMIAAAPA
jgi:hypothetical protein